VTDFNNWSDIYRTTCAADNNCKSPCITPEYPYDFQYGTAEWDAAYATYEVENQECRELNIQLNAAGNDFD
jgi:hypothetical protein